MSINVKEKSCNLFKTYISVVLAENWLFSSTLVEEKPVLRDMWAVFLRNCSCQINSTDLRSYASKVSRKRITSKPFIIFLTLIHVFNYRVTVLVPWLLTGSYQSRLSSSRMQQQLKGYI